MAENNYSFVVVTCPGRETAGDALKTLRQVEKEHLVSVVDAIAVSKNRHGKVKLMQSKGATGGKGSIAGGVLGLIVGLVAGGPVALALMGAVAGGVAGKYLDTGLKDRVMKQLGEELKPEDSALCVLIENADWAVLQARMARFDGEVLVSELSDEAIKALEKLADRDEISTAVVKQIVEDG